MLRVRLVRPFGARTFEAGGARFSTEIAAADADALLCEWAPHPELLDFPGPAAWYTAEPRANPRIGVLAHADQRRYLELLRPEQLLHHAHEDERFRVPHMTHGVFEPTRYPGARLPKAVGVVSNYGGPIHNRGPGVRLRNAFVTAAGVDLYGRPDKWRHYRPGWLSWPRPPASFVSGVEETGVDKVSLVARYHTAICLENGIEPMYFSEKFVDGVRAGCVPVYRAHPTVRDGVLRGARWVDPADFDLDPAATLAHALSLDREEVAEQNYRWLETDAVAATSEERVFAKIADALRHQATMETV